jgi:hypothetical protein
MLEVSCSSSGQRLHLELPDILELLSSSLSRVLPLACARIPVKLQLLMLPLSYPSSCFFERYRLGVSQTGIPSVLCLFQTSPVHSNFLGFFDLISFELDISSELFENVTTSTRVGCPTLSYSSSTHVSSFSLE